MKQIILTLILFCFVACQSSDSSDKEIVYVSGGAITVSEDELTIILNIMPSREIKKDIFDQDFFENADANRRIWERDFYFLTIEKNKHGEYELYRSFNVLNKTNVRKEKIERDGDEWKEVVYLLKKSLSQKDIRTALFYYQQKIGRVSKRVPREKTVGSPESADILLEAALRYMKEG